MYKIGDKVRIKSIEWYDKNKNVNGYFRVGGNTFIEPMSSYCGREAVIIGIVGGEYKINVDEQTWNWRGEMFETVELNERVEQKTFWYAVDEEGFGCLHRGKPERNGVTWSNIDDFPVFISEMTKEFFPPLTWEDEPIQIEIKKI